MKYPHVLFDLDGTLIESEEGILNSVEFALNCLGKPSPGREALRGFIGPPLVESFEKIGSLTKDEAQEATRLYRQRYSKTGIFECKLYPGLEALLQKMAAGGMAAHLATAKPEEYALQILRHFGILPLFQTVAGIPMALGHYEKADIIGRVLAENSISPAEAVMVGDRFYDIEGAAACGVASIGVLYGYGSRKELAEAGATHLAENAKDLESLLFC